MGHECQASPLHAQQATSWLPTGSCGRWRTTTAWTVSHSSLCTVSALVLQCRSSHLISASAFFANIATLPCGLLRMPPMMAVQTAKHQARWHAGQSIVPKLGQRQTACLPRCAHSKDARKAPRWACSARRRCGLTPTRLHRAHLAVPSCRVQVVLDANTPEGMHLFLVFLSRRHRSTYLPTLSSSAAPLPLAGS